MGWKHVIPQLIEKVRAAVARGEDRIEIQGDGSETRAFCYVDDVVDGILTMWQNGETMNVYHIGAMEEVPIRHLAELVADAVGKTMELVPGEIGRESCRERGWQDVKVQVVAGPLKKKK